VSDFGFSVLHALSDDPLFSMSDLNPKLCARVAKLKKAFEWRRLAALSFPYLYTCKARMKEEETKE
jgi:hypothetical protein